jgi:hypothetical protein
MDTSESYARWLAGRCLCNDSAIEEGICLPACVPANEVRPLRLNRLRNVPEPDAVEPLDSTPEADVFDRTTE